MTIYQKKVGNTFNTFFRVIGLSIVNFILRLLGHKSLREGPKEILQRSWSAAVIRNIIHIVPIGGAITIAYLNIAGFYVGDSFDGILALQFAAKLHEILIIASLSHIMLFQVRNEVVSNHGLPFGALNSGFQISQPNYLWSLELWGVLTASAFSWCRKIRFLAFVISSITLAASVGPSSAVGMIPRIKWWPDSPTTIWFNTTEDQIFPAYMSAHNISKKCANSSALGTWMRCPWNGWQDYIYAYGSTINMDVNETPHTLYLGSNMPEIHRNISSSREITMDMDIPITAFATSQHGAIIQALDLMESVRMMMNQKTTESVRVVDHKRVKEKDIQPATTDFVLTAEFFQPFVTVSPLGFDQMKGPEDVGTVEMSAPNSSFYFHKTLDMYNTPGDPKRPRLVFVDFVSASSGEDTLGAVVLHGRVSQHAALNLTTYLIEASWVCSQANWTNAGSEASRTTSSNHCEYYQEDVTRNPADYHSDATCARSISIPSEWAKYTNPFVPELNATAFTQFCMGGNLQDGSDTFDYIECTAESLAFLIANGLSNFGNGVADHVEFPGGMKGDPNTTILHSTNTDLEHDTTPKAFNISISYHKRGYTYNSDGVFIKIAIVALLAYASIALTFVLYTSFRGVSSSAWDSIAELTALAINSPPSSQLADTCGGITSLNTYKSMARVIAVDGATSGTRYRGRHSHGQTQKSGIKHAQLVFEDGGKTRLADCESKGKQESDGERIQINERYGACPSS